jgi:hypothetical protein
MKKIILLFSLFASLTSSAQIKHFLFLGMDRDQLKDTNYWKPELFDGVQIAYSWRQLESSKDNYDFSIIKEDLKWLKKSGKKLFIQFQDVSFYMKYNNTPKYLLEDTSYHGGANKQYSFNDNDERQYREVGWVTRRWDPQVQKRLHKIYEALGKEFDGVIEGINIEETAVDFGSGALHPPGFTFKRYKEAVIENLAALKKAFPRSVVMAYANFMPGGWRPTGDTTLLRDIYQFAWANNIGVGGPDLFPYKRGQMNNSYGLIRESYKKTVTALAVQDGNYEYINPATSKKIRGEEIFQFAKEYLHLSYIFWGTEEPFYHAETIPLLQRLK